MFLLVKSKSTLDILYFYWSNLSQHLTYFISIGQNVGKNLHKVENQWALGVLADTLINKLTQQIYKR